MLAYRKTKSRAVVRIPENMTLEQPVVRVKVPDAYSVLLGISEKVKALLLEFQLPGSTRFVEEPQQLRRAQMFLPV